MSSALAIVPRDPDAIDCPFAEGAWWGVAHWAEHPATTRACADLAERLAPLRPLVVARCASPLWTETLLRATDALAFVTREVAPALLLRLPRPAEPSKHVPRRFELDAVAEELRRAEGGEALRDLFDGAREAWTGVGWLGPTALLYDVSLAWTHATIAAERRDPDRMYVAGRCAAWLAATAGSPCGSARPELDTWEPSERLAGILAGEAGP